jgi:hypothetical protein
MHSGAGTGDSQASGTGSQVINMRCLIVTMDASVIIGKQGRHIADIRVSVGGRYRSIVLIIADSSILVLTSIRRKRTLVSTSRNRFLETLNVF